MLVTRHASIAKAVALKRGFGVDRTLGDPALPGTYDVPELGFNYRMSEMQAALGRSQLRRIDDNLARRKLNFETMKQVFAARPDLVVLDAAEAGSRSSHYCLSLVLNGRYASKRNALVARLGAAKVGTSVYYPHPVPRLRYYHEKYGTDAARYKQAATISDQSVALPVGPHVSPEDARDIAETCLNLLDEI